jgi:uncharacterized repeat protein (TIGR01451 family)
VNGSGTTGDAGDPVEYTISIRHSGNTQIDAYEVTADDILAHGTSYYTDGIYKPIASVGDSVVITYYAQIGADYFRQSFGTSPF